MTRLDDGTIVTDLDASAINQSLLENGYSVRYVETWHHHDCQSFVHWDTPKITEGDLPF